MAQRKHLVSVLLSDEEFDTVSTAVAVTKVKLAKHLRELALLWATRALNKPGYVPNGLCGRANCVKEPAAWWDYVDQMFVCEGCSSTNVCRKEVPPHMKLAQEITAPVNVIAEIKRLVEKL